MKIIIVVPVFNEEKILKQNILKIFEFCNNNLSIDWQIIIADNKSTDQTSNIGKTLALVYQEVEYLYVDKQGKGVAIKTAWEKYSGDIYCFMDADLATGLSALPPLINGFTGGYDLVIGSRYHVHSKVNRTFIRKIFSLGYRLVLKIFLGLKVLDAPCGFKAINSKIKENILPKVQNDKWFFDSELLILVYKQGYKIKEIPVTWLDPREGKDKSRVKAISLSWNYFIQILAIKKRLKDNNE
ncbi:glycosyl transferase [bacterium]|nr:glycosyl transferase [bacterium]|tara:strand:+ start:2006 stop:2728 length:723 start_codon:yes stop_codon:yes gene_type:complete